MLSKKYQKIGFFHSYFIPLGCVENEFEIIVYIFLSSFIMNFFSESIEKIIKPIEKFQ